MYKLKQKLKSQTGASITFALLLFLVCAVVGSAVLVAGTAAAGRMSKIAEMDQRYYAVNSAARLLVDTIGKESVTIVKMNPIDSTDSTDGGGGGNSSGQEGTPGTGSATSEKNSFPRDAAKKLGLLGGGGITLPSTEVFTLSCQDEIKDSIEATISETVNPDGTMVLTVSKGEGDQFYALRLTFEMDKQETSVLDLQKKTETITTVLDWRLTDIETVVNKPKQTEQPTNTPETGG